MSPAYSYSSQQMIIMAVHRYDGLFERWPRRSQMAHACSKAGYLCKKEAVVLSSVLEYARVCRGRCFCILDAPVRAKGRGLARIVGFFI